MVVCYSCLYRENGCPGSTCACIDCPYDCAPHADCEILLRSKERQIKRGPEIFQILVEVEP